MAEAATHSQFGAAPDIQEPADAQSGLAARRHHNFMIAEMLRNHPSRRRSSPAWHHIRMGLVGFLSGCLLVVPSVLIATGHLQLLPDLPVWRTPAGYPVPASADVVPAVSGATKTEPMLVRSPEPARRPIVVMEPPLKDDAALAEAIATAVALLDRGDIRRVRQILAEDIVIQSPEAAFLLAETYDPNVIAGRNLAGVEADVARARRYYSSALIGGHEPARQRLKALE